MENHVAELMRGLRALINQSLWNFRVTSTVHDPPWYRPVYV